MPLAHRSARDREKAPRVGRGPAQRDRVDRHVLAGGPVQLPQPGVRGGAREGADKPAVPTGPETEMLGQKPLFT